MLIGLHGRAGSGKDTACTFIQAWGGEHGEKVRRDAFADRLKLSAARMFFPAADLEFALKWCNLVKEDGTLTVLVENDVGRTATAITGREWLQRYGTECHREVFAQDFWVDAALRDHSSDEILVITDVRFRNEADAIRARDGVVWRIDRTDMAAPEDLHPSERPLPDSCVDHVIVTDGNLRTLEYGVRAALFNLLGGSSPAP